VLTSTYNTYQTWDGRSVADFITFLFMLFRNKNIFNVCNTIVYCVFVFLIGFHVTGSFKKVSAMFFMFINILIWLVVSSWGQTLLWLTGSCNYLWTSTLILLFLVPFRKKVENSSYKSHITISFFWIIPGLLAGWSIENSASGVLILLAAYFILKKYRKERAAAFEIFGSIGFIFGFFMLIRGVREPLYYGFSELIVYTAAVVFPFIFYEALLLGAISILAIELIRFRKTPVAKTTYGYFIAASGSVAAMISPGYYGGRSAFITQVFLLIALLSLVIQIKQIIPRRCATAVITMLILAFISSFYAGSEDIIQGSLYAEARERYILSEKQRGNLAIKVKTPIPASNTHSGMYDGFDVLDDSVSNREYIAHNSAKAAWYGIESLDGIPTIRKLNVMTSIERFLSHRG